jgi:ADP-ribosyl-[dinitrogen reductase] hydrolase
VDRRYFDGSLCLAESLIETRGFDPVDQLVRYVRWYREGHLSSTNTCFDIGLTVRKALMRFERIREPYCGSTDPQTAGNGSLMRLAPVPLRWAKQPETAIENARESSRTTHGALTAVDSCRYFAGLILGALRGAEKDTLLSSGFSPVPDYWQRFPLAPEIDEIASGSFKRKECRGRSSRVVSLYILWKLRCGHFIAVVHSKKDVVWR